MSIITSQQISKYYDQYAQIEVTFTKDVTKVVKLVSKQVFLKCLGYQWPCIIYSSSMTGAKIIANVKSSIQEITRKANNVVALRYSIRQSDKGDPVSFYVAAKTIGYAPYGPQNPDLNFVSLSFTQRPADDLIEILGTLLDANVNSKKRKEDRIILTADTMRKIGIKAKETTLMIQGVPRKGIIRDLSFSGAKVIIFGIAKFLIEKEIIFKIELEDSVETIDIPGSIVRHEEVEGRKDIAAFAIQFKEDKIPMRYKLLINDYIKQFDKRKDAET
jgi:hypothetical protein